MSSPARRIRHVLLSAAAGLFALATVLCGATSIGAPHQPRAASADPGAVPGGVEVDALSIGVPRTAPVQTTSSLGFQLLNSAIVGETPAGFGVWVSSSAPHHSVIARNAAAGVTALRGLGIPIAYRGYGTPASREGVVRVFEGTKGCGSNSTTVGVTWTYWQTLSTNSRYVTRADVWLCPRLFRMSSWATRATVGHELGHAMGLGHMPYRYLSSYQLMNPTVRSSVVSYRAGDVRGLRKLAAATSLVRAEVPPAGRLASSTYSSGNILVRGSAKLTYWPGERVAVFLTDNGATIRTGTTDSATNYGFSVPWRGGEHRYCVVARGVVHTLAKAQLGCVTWRG